MKYYLIRDKNDRIPGALRGKKGGSCDVATGKIPWEGFFENEAGAKCAIGHKVNGAWPRSNPPKRSDFEIVEVEVDIKLTGSVMVLEDK